MWDFLRQGFDYDLWANRLWLPCLEGAQDYAIMEHLLGAHTIWVERVQGHSPASFPKVEVSEASLLDLHDQWRAAIDGNERMIHFRRTTGEEHALTLTEIGRHVLNHGTYHRGELRGLRRTTDSEAFPETDMARYFLELER